MKETLADVERYKQHAISPFSETSSFVRADRMAAAERKR